MRGLDHVSGLKHCRVGGRRGSSLGNTICRLHDGWFRREARGGALNGYKSIEYALGSRRKGHKHGVKEDGRCADRGDK